MVGCFWKTWQSSVFIAVPLQGLHLKVYIHSLGSQTNFKINSLGSESTDTISAELSVDNSEYLINFL